MNASREILRHRQAPVSLSGRGVFKGSWRHLSELEAEDVARVAEAFGGPVEMAKIGSLHEPVESAKELVDLFGSVLGRQFPQWRRGAIGIETGVLVLELFEFLMILEMK